MCSAKLHHPLKTKPRSTKSQGGTTAHAGRLRIIGGHWRRLNLKVADVPGLRPTSDRLRETLFNWLGQDCTGLTVLDAFAGTGALGLEAASRGASEVTWIEANLKAMAGLKSNIHDLLPHWPEALAHQKPVLNTFAGQIQNWQNQNRTMFDLMFLDPPFDSNLLHECWPLLRPWLAIGGMMYVEWRESLFGHRPFDELKPSQMGLAMHEAGLKLVRYAKLGQVHAHVLELHNVGGSLPRHI